VKSVDKDIPTTAEVAKMILAAGEEDALWGLFVKITATLGTRRGETCALRWEDLDSSSQRVLVRRAACVSRDVLTVKVPKSGRSRTLHIPSDAFCRGLEEFRSPKGFLFRGWFAILFGAENWSVGARTSAGTSTRRATGSAA
jgi:integrase